MGDGNVCADLPVYEGHWERIAIRTSTGVSHAAGSKDCGLQLAQEHAEVLLRDVSPPAHTLAILVLPLLEGLFSF